MNSTVSALWPAAEAHERTSLPAAGSAMTNRAESTRL